MSRACLKRLKTTKGLVSRSPKWCQNVGGFTSTEFFPNVSNLSGRSSNERPWASRYLVKPPTRDTGAMEHERPWVPRYQNRTQANGVLKKCKLHEGYKEALNLTLLYSERRLRPSCAACTSGQTTRVRGTTLMWYLVPFSPTQRPLNREFNQAERLSFAPVAVFSARLADRVVKNKLSPLVDK